MMFFWFCCTVFVVALQSAPVISNDIPTVALEPDRLRCGEKLHNGESMYYQLTKLQRNTGYEIRISYAAVIPTEFIIKLVDMTGTTGRKLMNIDKLVFHTTTDEEEKYVQVTAFRVGVPVKSNLMKHPVEYDIILDSLYSGLPLNVWKMAIYIFITIFIIVKYCLQPAMNWVNNETGKLE